MKSVLAIFLLIGIANASSHERFIKDDNGLDPGRITWAMNTWYSAPIIPSVNQLGTLTSVSLTFYFRADTSTTGRIEIICPTGVTCGTTFVNQDVDGGMDGSVTFSSVSVTAGTFGPFGLITRNSSGGSIVDANYVFGHITILDDVTPSTVAVSSSDSSITTIGIGESIELDFTFTLTVDLWKYDVIVIGVDSGYTASSTPTCTSETITGVDN